MGPDVISEEVCNGLLMLLNGEKSGKGVVKIVAGFAGALKKIPELFR